MSNASAITVTSVPVLSSIQIGLSMRTGRTTQLTANCLDQNKNTITCPTLKWTSDNMNIATVSSSGVVTGITRGTVNITASSGTNISNMFLITIT